MQDRSGRISAFTLLELLVVIVILAILAGLIAYGVFSAKESAKRALAKVEVRTIEGGLVAYYNELYAYPPDTGDWGQGDQYDEESILKYLSRPVKLRSGKEVGPFLDLKDKRFVDGKLVDPWGNPYEIDAEHRKDGTMIGHPYLPSRPEGERYRKVKVMSRGGDGATAPYPFDHTGTPDPKTEDDITSW